MSWFFHHWNYRRRIEISPTNVDVTLTNFPLRIPLAQSDCVGAKSDGSDLMFTAADGVTPLYYVWAGWTDDNYSGAYTKVPSISSTDKTIIYMYYGNPLATDASDAANTLSDYYIFWTGDNWTTGQYDMTGNVQMTNRVGTLAAVNLDIGGGVQLTPTRSLGAGTTGDLYTALLGESGFMVSLSMHNWQYDATRSADGVFFTFGGDTTNSFEYLPDSDNQRFRFREDSTVPTPYMSCDGSVTLTPGDNFRAGYRFTLDGTNCNATSYHNGSATATDSGSYAPTELVFSTTSLASTVKTSIGNDTGYGIQAIVNQVRVKKHASETAAQIAAWKKFEYYNLMSATGEIDKRPVRNRIPVHILGGKI